MEAGKPSEPCDPGWANARRMERRSMQQAQVRLSIHRRRQPSNHPVRLLCGEPASLETSHFWSSAAACDEALSILESLPIIRNSAKPSRSCNANLAIRRTRGKLGVTKYAHSASLAKPAERNPPSRNPARRPKGVRSSRHLLSILLKSESRSD